MAYNIEQFRIKKLNRCRQILREFCVRGIPREQIMQETKSAYAQFRQVIDNVLEESLCKQGYKKVKRQFLAMDGRDFNENPLALFIKTKEFDDSELALHFDLLFILSSHDFMPQPTIINKSCCNPKIVRKVLKEYTNLGILEHRHVKNWDEYRLPESDIDISKYADILSFFSESNPFGIVGHYLKDRYRRKFNVFPKSHFRFSHRYLHHILDADLLETVFATIKSHSPVRVKLAHWVKAHEFKNIIPNNFFLVNNKGHQVSQGTPSQVWLATDVIPLKIYSSVHSGQRYIMGFYLESREFAQIRIDRIDELTPLSPSLEESDYARLQQQFRSFSEHLWGVSKSNAPQTVHVEMEILDNCPDSPVLTRLENEKRCGTVERISPNSARFSVDVYDGRELFPWLSTFIGNIMRMSFSDPSLTAAWEQRMNDMNDIYNI